MSAESWSEDATIVSNQSTGNLDARVQKFGDEILLLSGLGDGKAEAKAAAIAALIPKDDRKGRK